jgi:hypothetical protein
MGRADIDTQDVGAVGKDPKRRAGNRRAHISRFESEETSDVRQAIGTDLC